MGRRANLHAAAASSTALPAIDIATILDGRNTLYIVAPLGRGDQYAPLFGGLFGDLIRDQTYRVANASGGRPVGPLLAVLDEAANMPLRWLPEVASTCAGIGIQLVTVWQDRSQIEALYETEAQSLLNNHMTKVFFAGQTDQETLEYASMLCGEEDITSNSASADLQIGSNRKSASAQIVSKRLVPTDLLRVIPNSTALLLHNTLRPFHMVGRRVTEEPALADYVIERDEEENDDDEQVIAPDAISLTGEPLIQPGRRLRSRLGELVALAKRAPSEPMPLIGEYEVTDKMRERFKAAHITLDAEIIAHLQASETSPLQLGASSTPDPISSPETKRSPLGY